jgi:hypothetical protein
MKKEIAGEDITEEDKSKLQTWRTFLSAMFREMETKFKKLTKSNFPHFTYGTKKTSETAKKAFPNCFKVYFFKLEKAFTKRKHQKMFIKNAPPGFMLTGEVRHDDFGATDGAKVTANSRAILRSEIVKNKKRVPPGFRHRVWRRADYKAKRSQVMMLDSDAKNCTFEPETASLAPFIALAIKKYPESKGYYLNESEGIHKFAESMGQNFSERHKEVYKAGVLKQARRQYDKGEYEESDMTLRRVFNFESLLRRFDPEYMKKLIMEKSIMKIGSLGMGAKKPDKNEIGA